MSSDYARWRHPNRINLMAMIALTFTTGMIDAIGYLGLDRVFTANMTGNVVILAIGATGTASLPVAGPLVALAAYVVGAIIAGRTLRHTSNGWQPRTIRVLIAVGALVLILAPAVAWRSPVPGTAWALTITGILGVAMGMQAASARRVAVADVTTVVVTSTLTGLAADSALGGGKSPHWQRRLAAVIAMAMGAGCGALLIQISLPVGLAAVGALIIATVITATVLHRRENSSTTD